MEDICDRLKALADPLRLRILQLLPDEERCSDVLNVSELAEQLGVPQPTVSHHLRTLKQAGLVRCRKMCRDVYYWLDRQAVEACLDALRRTVLTKTSEGGGGAGHPL